MPQHETEAQAIRNLQTYLRQLSYHDASITAPPIDGIFDTDTQKSLMEFQTSHGLSPTGVADQAVFELLYAIYRASLAEHSAPLRLSVFPPFPENMRYTEGSQGFPVAAIQFILRELERKYGKIQLPDVTGVYDAATAQAVKAFQEQNALRPDGEVDRVTWNEMADQYNIQAQSFSQD